MLWRGHRPKNAGTVSILPEMPAIGKIATSNVPETPSKIKGYQHDVRIVTA